MSVVAPDLAQRWTSGDRSAFVARLAGGLAGRRSPSSSRPRSGCSSWPSRRWPCCSAMTTARRGHGDHRVGPGHVRPRTARLLYVPLHRARPAVDAADQGGLLLYLIENTINIALGVALVHPLGVRGLALSLSVAYTVGRCSDWRCFVAGSAASAPKGPGRRCAGWASPHWRWEPWSWWCPTSRAPRTARSSWLEWSVPWWPGSRSIWAVAVVLGRRAVARQRRFLRQTRQSRRLVARHRARNTCQRRHRGRLDPCPVCGS